MTEKVTEEGRKDGSERVTVKEKVTVNGRMKNKVTVKGRMRK